MDKDLLDKNSEAYKAKLELAKKAFEKGCFIHCKDSGKLYSPREFMESNERIKSEMYAQQNYSNMTLHYVDYLLRTKLEQLNTAQQEYNEFMKKVVNAFELSPKQPLQKRK